MSQMAEVLPRLLAEAEESLESFRSRCTACRTAFEEVERKLLQHESFIQQLLLGSVHEGRGQLEDFLKIMRHESSALAHLDGQLHCVLQQATRILEPLCTSKYQEDLEGAHKLLEERWEQLIQQATAKLLDIWFDGDSWRSESAESESEELAKAALLGGRVSPKVLLQALKAVSIPKERRLGPGSAQEAETAATPRALNLGLLRQRRQVVATEGSEKFRFLLRLISALFRQYGRQESWTSVVIHQDFRAPQHIDQHNLGPSLLMGLGDYEGGALWVEKACEPQPSDMVVREVQGVMGAAKKFYSEGQRVDGHALETRGRVIAFDASFLHETLPFEVKEGSHRYTISFYISDALLQATFPQRECLRSWGVRVPSDEVVKELRKKKEAHLLHRRANKFKQCGSELRIRLEKQKIAQASASGSSSSQEQPPAKRQRLRTKSRGPDATGREPQQAPAPQDGPSPRSMEEEAVQPPPPPLLPCKEEPEEEAEDTPKAGGSRASSSAGPRSRFVPHPSPAAEAMKEATTKVFGINSNQPGGGGTQALRDGVEKLKKLAQKLESTARLRVQYLLEGMLSPPHFQAKTPGTWRPFLVEVLRLCGVGRSELEDLKSRHRLTYESADIQESLKAITRLKVSKRWKETKEGGQGPGPSSTSKAVKRERGGKKP